MLTVVRDYWISRAAAVFQEIAPTSAHSRGRGRSRSREERRRYVSPSQYIAGEGDGGDRWAME
jgi:hypothetical protein